MKFTRFFIFAALIAILASCGGKKEKQEQEQLNGMPAMETTNTDSVAVRKLVKDFMDQIVAGEYDMAANMLRDTYKTDSATGKPLDLSPEVRNAYLTTFKEFDIKDYSIRQITFSDYKDNEVKCEVILENGIPTNWYFKPIKCIGEWYLGMRDTSRGDRPMHMDD